MRSESDIQTAVDAGANALGFLVGLTHFSEDRLEVRQAQRLIATVPPFITPVLVTHLHDPQEIVDLHDHVAAGVIQLHGEMTDEEVLAVRNLLPHARLIKALHVRPEMPQAALIQMAQRLEPIVNALLLDSRTADRLGGTGEVHDWSISRQVREAVRVPLVLAGGLKPTNVREAAQRVRPDAVDVNSGVEDELGNKDPKACAAFVMAARSALEVPFETPSFGR